MKEKLKSEFDGTFETVWSMFEIPLFRKTNIEKVFLKTVFEKLHFETKQTHEK